MSLKLIDVGVNLTSSQFDHDRDEIVARAKQASIENMLLIGSCLDSSSQSLELAEKYDFVCTAGIHPHDAKDVPSNFLHNIRKLVEHKRVVAIGECGLDFNRDFSPRQTQQSVFQAQLELANSSN